jgi:hypothetical protein
MEAKDEPKTPVEEVPFTPPERGGTAVADAIQPRELTSSSSTQQKPVTPEVPPLALTRDEAIEAAARVLTDVARPRTGTTQRSDTPSSGRQELKEYSWNVGR